MTGCRADGHASLSGASFELRRGEIYGVAGVGGNGQTELAEILAGVRTPLAGHIAMAGVGDVASLNVGQRRALGLISIPADRQGYGLASELSIADNFCVTGVLAGRFGGWLRVDTSAARARAQDAVAAFDIRGVRSVRQKAALLSGGNAQKLVIAREFAVLPRIVIAHSPSRGLDVRASSDVHKRLREARDAGAGVLLISEDLDEVLLLSDRVGVMNRVELPASLRHRWIDRQSAPRWCIMLDAHQTIDATPPVAGHRFVRWMRARTRLEIRQHMPAWQQALIIAAGFLIGCAASAVILIVSGVSVADLVHEFGTSIFSSSKSMSAVVVRAAPLLLAGLSASVALRVRFWNIGIEGQMIFGSIAATAVVVYGIGPVPLRIFTMAVFAIVGGAAWIVVPALLRLRLGINEIISTLLLNYVAFDFLLHLLYGSWKDPSSNFPHSTPFGATEKLGLLGWEGVTYAAPLALVLSVACWWLLNVSRFGFFTRFAQANPRMAGAVGLPLSSILLGSALLSGALSGIAGFVVTAGLEYRLTQSFFTGYGFSGILIAFLARCNPIGAVAVSFLVAVLFVVGESLQVFYQISSSMVQLVQAVIVIGVAGSEFFIRYRIH